MPFPLAHPAAALPFRRWCPRYLSFPALIVGSVVPDAGYLFEKSRLCDMSHQLPGVIFFALPLGAAVLLMIYWLGPKFARALPAPLRRVLLPLCECPLGSKLAVLISFVLGASLHILWDSFTHKDGWLVMQGSFLWSPLFKVGHRSARICHVLWYASTFAGVAWLVMAYQEWLQARTRPKAPKPQRVKLGNALVAATLILALGVVHHLADGLVFQLVVVGFSALLALGFLLWIGPGSSEGWRHQSEPLRVKQPLPLSRAHPVEQEEREQRREDSGQRANDQ